MPDQKISDMDAAAALVGTELVELVQSGDNVRSTVTAVGAVAAAAAVTAHEADTTAVHGIADTSVLATATTVATAVSNHEADTTSVHGIANTANLYAAGGTDVAIADGGTGQSTAAAAFTALKQDATSTATGVVELATDAETLTGTDTGRATTPANVSAVYLKLAGGTTTGPILLPEGTAANPSIGWAGDPNTGLVHTESGGQIVDLVVNAAIKTRWFSGGATQIRGGASDATAADGTGQLQVGPSGSANLGIDGDEIQARDGAGAVASLNLNPAGGNVAHGGGITVVSDPSAGDMVGDRDYNDARYQALDADLTDIAGIADAQGDIIVRGASGWERLAKSGTSTHVLTAGASQPAWAAPAGGGAVATDVIFDAKGDLAVGTGADTASKLTVGTNNHVLTADSSTGTGLKWAAASATITTDQNYITANVAIVTAGTYYDGPTLTLAAGTWLLTGQLQFLAGTAATRTLEAKLWDGTTTISQSVYVVPGTAAAAQICLPLSAIVAPGGSTTYKISGTSSVTGSVDNIRGLTTKGSYLLAVKLG